ncbi:LapA family protein [Alteromonas antoniana]|uniref:LapA family protein n=1 Tax=Alteromonas antoniana TaxID=2803813 RepID=UPI001C45ADF2|nr:lipopolysaccharide assembly protein LapA domain-containing protein [Alteromonas antoniana]
MKGILFIIVVLVLLSLAFAIGSQNDALISVNYLIARAELRVSTLIAVTLSVGVVIGILIMMASWLSLRVKLIASRSKLRKLNKDH